MNDQARAAVVGWQQAVDAAWKRQAGQLGAASWIEPSGITRKLTPEEIAIAREVFGDSLDPSFVTVSEGGLLGVGDIARTIPYTITFPPDTLSNPPPNYKAWLVHELTHIWQYQHGRTVEELLGTALANDYDYEGVPGLEAALAQGKTFHQFNTEEQGQILRHYYERRASGQDTSAYDPFVRDVQDDGPPTPPWPPVPAF
jgi:hypothetical protein